MTTESGAQPTGKVIDQIAKEAEAGYDLSKAKKVTRGRPGLGPTGISSRVQVRLDPELHHALRTRARRENRSLSDVARSALREYVTSSPIR